MKYGIISDIHSNIHAYRKVVGILNKIVDEIVCLGDIVGYNANPRECIVLTQRCKRMKHIIRGNHDILASQGLRFGNSCNLSKDAFDGIVYTSKQITHNQKQWISSLKDNDLIGDVDLPFIVSHEGTLNLEKDGYIFDHYGASSFSRDVFLKSGFNLCFFGHTHVPTFFSCKKEELKDTSFVKDFIFDIGGKPIENKMYNIEDKNNFYLINTGSIGQPRYNGINSYAILDTCKKEIVFCHFKYDKNKAIEAVVKAGYSENISKRL